MIWFVYGLAGLAILNKIGVFDIKILGAAIEWTLTFILLNFFVFLNLFNNYYDTVHTVGKLVHLPKDQPSLLPTETKVEPEPVIAEEKLDESANEHSEAPAEVEESAAGVQTASNSIQ